MKLGGEYRFQKWMCLETQKEKIIKAVEQGDFSREFLSFLSTALGVNEKWFERADWKLLVELFYFSLKRMPVISLPITKPSGEEKKDEPWDYEGRIWHLYSHLLSKAYGWTLEYISRLHVVDAIAKIQEILTDEQLDREFVYQLSEVAYKYDKHTHKSSLVPLPRPSWMRPLIKPVQKIKIPISMMPVGVVMMDKVLPPDLMPKGYET